MDTRHYQSLQLIADRLAGLGTTASHIDSRLSGTRFKYPPFSSWGFSQVNNPVAGNNLIVTEPAGANTNFIHQIHMSFNASHVAAKEISLRQGTAGQFFYTTFIPTGVFTLDIELPSTPLDLFTDVYCFVSSGFSALGNYGIYYTIGTTTQ